MTGAQVFRRRGADACRGVVVARGLVVAAIGLSCTACSFAFVSRPPEHPERLKPFEPVECTSSDAAPILDTVAMSLEIARTVYALTAPDSTYRNFPISRPVDVGLGLGLSLLFLTSALYGFDATNDCDAAQELHKRKAREAWSDRQRVGAPLQPQPGSVPPGTTAPSAPPPAVP